MPELLDLLDVDEPITHRFPLLDAEKDLDALRRRTEAGSEPLATVGMTWEDPVLWSGAGVASRRLI